MNYTLTIASILLLLLPCCTRKTPSTHSDTPQSLQEKGKEYFSFRKSSGNTFDYLYQEIAASDTALQFLEDKLNELIRVKGDSLHAFDHFDRNSRLYYNAASRYIEDVSDSALRSVMENMIKKSIARYNVLVAQDTQLVALIDLKSVQLKDLRGYLKIVKTLPVMEAYQNKNKPDDAPIRHYIKEQDSAMLRLRTLLH